MGVDDLAGLQLVLPMLALLITLVVSGPASCASHIAWKWSLARIANRRTAAPALVLSVVALLPTGAPLAYCVPLTAALPGLLGTLGLVFVTALSAAALVHAAYRVECIRQVARDPELSDALSRVPYTGDRQAYIEEQTGGLNLPAFVGATRRRSLILAGIVFSGWGFVAVLLAAR